MSLNIGSVFMFLGVVAKGIGVAEELQKLAERILAGEVITEAEVEKYLEDNANALAKWKSTDNRDAMNGPTGVMPTIKTTADDLPKHTN